MTKQKQSGRLDSNLVYLCQGSGRVRSFFLGYTTAIKNAKDRKEILINGFQLLMNGSGIHMSDVDREKMADGNLDGKKLFVHRPVEST